MNHKQAIKTVQEYGATQLHKRDQKRLTQEKIVRELKVAPKANQKMPLKMLVGASACVCVCICVHACACMVFS
jgi:hypothetical protein